MFASLLMFVLTAIFLIAPLYLRWEGKKRGDFKLPPGFSKWSLIGDSVSLLKPCSATSIGDFMETRMSRYGKIFTTNLLGKPVIVSADPELNRFVLQNEMRLFENTWQGAIRDTFGRKNIAMQVGEAHKQLKSIITTMFSISRLRNSSFEKNIDELATQLFSSWKDGSIISAADAAKQFSFNVIVKNALGMDAGEFETEKLRADIARLYVRILILPLNFPGTHYYKSLQSRRSILKVIKEVTEKRKNAEGNTRDKTDDLLTWVIKNTSLSMEQIGDLLLGVIFAGVHTTSSTIASCVYFLEGCPKAIKQLREEHLQFVRSRKQDGGIKLTLDDYKQMEFTQCVINETLRLGNAARMLMKKASTDIEFKGYKIPSGCKIITNMSAVHLDPSIFEEPENFNPWRWLSSSGIKKSNNFMPFGGGPRLCPGLELARLEIAIFLHHLILNYDWKLIEDDHPIALPIVKFPKGLPIKLRALSVCS